MRKKTTAKTHQIVAELMLIGIDIQEINQKIYQTKPHSVALAQATSMVGIQFFFNGRLGVVKITREIAQLNQGKIDEIDGLIDWLCEIKDVEIGCVLKECDNQHTRVSLRSRNSWDILSLAHKYNGGGHWETVGFVLEKSIYDAEFQIINELEFIFNDFKS